MNTSAPSSSFTLPSLPLADWKNCKTTLHLYTQILGKLKLQLMPRKNHWWNITLKLSPMGLTTGPMPAGDLHHLLELQLNLREHRLDFFHSGHGKHSFPLEDGLTVAEYFQQVMQQLANWDISLQILDHPYDLPIKQKFAEIEHFHYYDKEAITRYWHILRWNHNVFQEYSGRFYGKSCPVQLYWHSFDLTVTRFSGKRGPDLPESNVVNKDGYSHENISCGFWAGDDNMKEPAYYCYTYPAPPQLVDEPLKPAAAFWVEQNGNPMAILKYHDLIKSTGPAKELLAFMESAYQAGARRANWPINDLKVPALDEL